jgi:hypothetical protein
VWPRNQTLWISAQDFHQATRRSSYLHRSPGPACTRHSPQPQTHVQQYPHKFPQQLDTPGQDPPQPKLRLTLVISTLHYIAPSGLLVICTNSLKQLDTQATSRICIAHLGTPIICTRVPKQLDTPVHCYRALDNGWIYLHKCLLTVGLMSGKFPPVALEPLVASTAQGSFCRRAKYWPCSLHVSRPPPRLKLGFSPSHESTGHWVEFQWLTDPQGIQVSHQLLRRPKQLDSPCQSPSVPEAPSI